MGLHQRQKVGSVTTAEPEESSNTLLEMLLTETDISKKKPVLGRSVTITPQKPTEEQRGKIGYLRQMALNQKSEEVQIIARSKCEPTFVAAEIYIKRLEAAMQKAAQEAAKKVTENQQEIKFRKEPGPVTGTWPVTAKQWAYIKHLRYTLRKVKEGWANELAKKEIGNCRTTASNYIKSILDALNRRFPQTAANNRGNGGGMICCCRVEGCKIGPFVAR